MTLRLILIAVQAFLLRGTIDDPARPLRTAWLVIESMLLVIFIAYALYTHESEVEKSRNSLPPWRQP